MIDYSPKYKLYRWQGPYEDILEPYNAGFDWSTKLRAWITVSPYKAYLLGYRDPVMDFNLDRSHALEPLIGGCPHPQGLSYYPFQEAGIEYLAYQLGEGRRCLLNADQQGTGKTIQGIGLANYMDYSKLLVICPASLRLNWAREIDKWHMLNEGVTPILSSSDSPSKKGSVITSYHLAEAVQDFDPDFIIIDEGHYVKNAESLRTQRILGSKEYRGLINSAPTLMMTGTPIPNGRPTELWPYMFKGAPDIIDNMRYGAFERRFCNTYWDGYQDKIAGAKNTYELYIRLRTSGFMLRRLKKDVLKDLPPKRYKMVVFPQDNNTSKVIEKEAPFDAREIIAHGVPFGSPLPEIRREMGVAKTPVCCQYIVDMLQGGNDKLVVFARHKEVIAILKERLEPWGLVCIDGQTPQKNRAAIVEQFQSDKSVRVFIGSEAAEEGWTLVAAHDCILVEPEWVPGKNDQKADRLHRIGQTRGVLIHLLVVERSLDAKILGSAADKAADIDKILGISA